MTGKILIIGGGGFVGSYLSRQLKRHGRSVIVLHRRPLTSDQKLPGVTYQRHFLPETTWAKPVQIAILAIQPDRPAFRQILANLAKLPQLKRIVYLSTLALYPNSPRPQPETRMVQPGNWYERAKRREELALRQFSRRYHLAIVIARLANVYGDVQNRGIIQRLITQPELVSINGDGRQSKDFIFVADAAELVARLTIGPLASAYAIFNICTGRGYQLRTVIGRLRTLLRQPLRQPHRPFPQNEKYCNIGANAKVVAWTGYRPRYGLTAGLRQTLANYRNYEKTHHHR